MREPLVKTQKKPHSMSKLCLSDEFEQDRFCFKALPGGWKQCRHPYRHRVWWEELWLFCKLWLLPFQPGIETGAGSILVSHNIVKSMDENLPASLSPAVHKILRDDLKLTGVIMTDDLKMEAIKEYIGDEAFAVWRSKREMIWSSHQTLIFKSHLY